MKRRYLIPVVVLLSLLGPNLARANSQVYVSFSVGGAVVIGAGVIYLGVSSSSRVSDSTPSEENPNRVSLTPPGSVENPLRTLYFLPQLLPHFLQPLVPPGEQPHGNFGFLPNNSRAASTVELPIFVFRW
jgi:hypothetical protein